LPTPRKTAVALAMAERISIQLQKQNAARIRKVDENPAAPETGRRPCMNYSPYAFSVPRTPNLFSKQFAAIAIGHC
jgi:hypothetical protein